MSRETPHAKCRSKSELIAQNSFGPLKVSFPGCVAGDRIIMRGTTATSDELIGNFSRALDDTSIGDYRLIGLFATAQETLCEMAYRSIGSSRLLQKKSAITRHFTARKKNGICRPRETMSLPSETGIPAGEVRLQHVLST